jgi:hypothetical protein
MKLLNTKYISFILFIFLGLGYGIRLDNTNESFNYESINTKNSIEYLSRSPTRSKRMIDGNPVSQGKKLNIAKILVYSRFKQLPDTCTANILTDRVLLTAASCFAELPSNSKDKPSMVSRHLKKIDICIGVRDVKYNYCDIKDPLVQKISLEADDLKTENIKKFIRLNLYWKYSLNDKANNLFRYGDLALIILPDNYKNKKINKPNINFIKTNTEPIRIASKDYTTNMDKYIYNSNIWDSKNKIGRVLGYGKVQLNSKFDQSSKYGIADGDFKIISKNEAKKYYNKNCINCINIKDLIFAQSMPSYYKYQSINTYEDIKKPKLCAGDLGAPLYLKTLLIESELLPGTDRYHTVPIVDKDQYDNNALPEVLLGIVVQFKKECNGYFNTFIKVSNYIEWIENELINRCKLPNHWDKIKSKISPTNEHIDNYNQYLRYPTSDTINYIQKNMVDNYGSNIYGLDHTGYDLKKYNDYKTQTAK